MNSVEYALCTWWSLAGGIKSKLILAQVDIPILGMKLAFKGFKTALIVLWDPQISEVPHHGRWGSEVMANLVEIEKTCPAFKFK